MEEGQALLMEIALFFVGHWVLSLFMQTFFLHRYAAHRMFTLSKGWERFFYVLTFVFQGASFLTPRAYAILHRMHHAYSDTPKDPHSPRNHSNVISLLASTWRNYAGFAYFRTEPEARFAGGYPEIKWLDRMGSVWPTRLVWGALYTLFYFKFATSPWQYLLLPMHYFMGPLHGTIVNWCGHRYGYRNFNSDDDSKNTLIFDFLTLGELFQNNHHRYGQAPNFAVRWFEIDPAYQVMRVLNWLKIIDLGKAPQQGRYPDAAAQNKSSGSKPADRQDVSKPALPPRTAAI